MIRVYVADSLPEERSALRLMLLDLKMEVVGEAADWASAFNLIPASQPNMLLVDWNMLPPDSTAAFSALRAACPAPVVIVLISQLDARQQAALSSGVDAFISKSETPDQVAKRLQAAAETLFD